MGSTKLKEVRSLTQSHTLCVSPSQDKNLGILKVPSKPAHSFCIISQPVDPREVRVKMTPPLALTSARRECLWTFSPFCTLGASCCRTPLLLVRALVSRANFPQPGACAGEKRQVQTRPDSTWTLTPQPHRQKQTPIVDLSSREALSLPCESDSLLRRAPRCTQMCVTIDLSPALPLYPNQSIVK